MMPLRVLTKRLPTRRLQATTLRALSTEVPPAAVEALGAAASKEEAAEAPEATPEELGNLAGIPISQATEAHRLKFFSFAKEQQEQLFPEGILRRMDEMFDLVGHCHIMLRDTTLQIISAMKDWETTKSSTIGAYLIDGDRGTGKTFALHQIVQFARESNWVVLYIPNPRSWCTEAPYVMQSPYQEGKFDIDVYGVDLLQKFLQCHGEQLSKVSVRGKYGERYYPAGKFEAKPKTYAEYKDEALTLRDIVLNGIRDEELACQAVCDLKEELAQVTEFPVLIAIDDYNTWFQKTVFGYEGKSVEPDDISVIAALKDIGTKGYNESRKLKNGLFVAAVTENFPTKTHFKQQVDYRKLRATMRTYTPEELAAVVSYYNQVSFLHDKPTDSQLAYFRLMTKALPLHVFDPPRATLTSADVKKLMEAAQRMQLAGQKNHPKYQQIVSLLRQYQQQQLARQRQAQTQAQANARAPLEVAANPFMQQKTTLFSEKQLEYLHNQIRAFKALCHSMDTAVTQAKQLNNTATLMQQHLGKDTTMGVLRDRQMQMPVVAMELMTPKWTRKNRNLLFIGPKWLDGDLIGIENKGNTAFGPFNVCSPCLGTNDVAMKMRYMHTLQQFLTSSLEKMESHTVDLDENEQRTLRDLRCVLLQQKLQRQVAKAHTTRLALLGEPAAVDRKAFRRRRPVSRLELQSDEREKRKKSVAMEKKRRADHQMYLKAILNHSREFFAYHKNVKAQVSKSAKAVKGFFDQKASKAEREEDRQEKLRLKALKANDMEAYGKLVAEAKNERLTYLLTQTNSYLDSIRQLVRQHKRKHHVVDEYTAHYDAHHDGAKNSEPDDQDDDLNYLEIASKGELPRQPLMLVGGDLKEYQLRGLQWMVSLYDNHLNGILADEMGLGKTIQSISLLTYVTEVKHNHGPFLVVVPLSTLSNWVNEFKKWAPDLVLVVYKGPPQVRKELHKQEMASCQFNVLLTTYEYIMKDKHVLRKYDWQYIIVDEGHRMKNAQSKFAMTLGTMYTSRNRLLLTGTPLQNSLPELWALLNFLLPTIFESVDTFEQWFSKPFAQFSGNGESNELSDEERMLIINRLHQVLRPFLLRRVKSSVLDQLPDKVEKVLKCELSGWQKIMYRRIQEGGALLMETTDDSGKKKGKTKYTSKGLSNVLMQLRKVCNHPYLFQINGYQIDFDIVRSSGKFELLDRMLPKLKAAGHRVLMFSQMTQLMHVLEDYFNYRGFRYLRLDGSTSADEREQRMFMFNAPDSPFFIFLLSTRAGGLGLNLATADTVIIFDSDWNPAMDAQAQDRAHRIGQKNEVRVFRLVTNSPVEEKILSRATDKMNMNNLVVEAGKFNNRSKEAERRAMLESLIKMEQEEAAHAAHEDESSTVLLDDEINAMMALTDEELTLYHRLDTERKAREAREWAEYCKQMNIPHTPRHRLMAEKDAPAWLREANEIMEHDIANGKQDANSWNFDMEAVAGKPRKRKEMSYRDQFTDAEFVRMCEDGIDESEARQAVKSPKEAKHGKRKREEDDEFADVGEDGAVGDVNDDDTSRRERKVLSYFYRKIYDSVMKLKDPTGRPRTDLYLEKPSAMDYPDYYTIVKHPMDLATIKMRIDKYIYASHTHFETDWNLMVSNAQLYNHPQSLVVFDALEIEKCITSKLKPLRLKTAEQLAADYETAKHDHKRRSKARKEKKRSRRG
ncbi:hypothetical protein BBO99_00000378 [Phytophthora kernoviae]|uniref:Uncharacterized protein n=2 Tax=Phytophthora kernoviae TaxID=325452 RepID=A0A421F0Z1_9STRA|nr:hypothetical protein G195_001240 [Phytophthora kernoviae 00238/432]KAG2532223.1 hypothetical protein JM16_000428 [Phytophthora kernoviae]KAG2533269.1 hypothetical protein JM18_000541 [Phytophthora kernoviae]RLN14516.1 hypothetical protein BBI17_000439 [Phytophthora kernoviae]RLN85599.1 hypothetical protein BBO99_00000378 [Phytophthora kernoviae]